MTDIFEANGAKFIAADDMIVRWCRKTGRPFEPDTWAWMQNVLATDDLAFVDCGVSTGWFTIPVLLSGRHVFGYEPNARALNRLQANIELNGIWQNDRYSALVFHAAVSDRDGVARFSYNPTLPLTSGGSLEPGIGANSASEEVRVVTLDGTVDRSVGLIKIDVEGHEINVLAGAAGVIARDRPHLVLEANTDYHRDQLAAWLAANDYDWFAADHRNMLCSPAS